MRNIGSIFLILLGTTIINPQLKVAESLDVKEYPVKKQKIDSLITNITEDVSLARQEKTQLEKTVEKNKLLIQERNARVERILKKLKLRKSDKNNIVNTVVRKEVVTIAKETYTIKKDSTCERKSVFSKKCIKWNPYYYLIDNKTKDTLILKQK